MTRLDHRVIDREIEVLTAQLAVLHRQEDHYNRILTEMNRLQESVQAEKGTLNSRIAELQSQKIPINWLPPELLTQVFLICAEDNLDYTGTAGFPYNPGPVYISHVCQKWRRLALATSKLWSFISYQCIPFKSQPIKTFLDRSGHSEITFSFVSPLDDVVLDAPVAAGNERSTAEALIGVLSHHFSRIRSIAFECYFAATMSVVFPTMHVGVFPKLRSLNLAVSSRDPSVDRPTLLTSGDTLGEGTSPTNSALANLRLQQVALTRLPYYLLRTVRTLELSYSRRRSATVPHHFVPTMSQVVQLLRHTSQLSGLSLVGVSPIWDVMTAAQGSGPMLTGVVEMPTLLSLSWRYAYPRDVYPFFSVLVAPHLERLDLLLAQSPNKRYEVSQFRGNHTNDQDSFTQAEPLANVVTLSALKELNVSCQNEDTPSSSLRQFLFPSLEKLDISFVGRHLRKDASLPALSRLESIFRDPRLPYLTHLSLSYFDIPHGQGKAMLAYMPNLISLTLGACTGVGVVLTALSESYGSLPNGQGQRVPRACGVRICPRLEELVLWSCHDFTFGSLFSVVYARSKSVDPSAPTSGVAGVDVASAVLGRKIRPLKKPRSAGVNIAQHADLGLHAAPGTISTLIPMQEALYPTTITCIHLEDCPPIREDQLLSLEELGAVVTLK